jgi:hypothetical protein
MIPHTTLRKALADPALLGSTTGSGMAQGKVWGAFAPTAGAGPLRFTKGLNRGGAS